MCYLKWAAVAAVVLGFVVHPMWFGLAFMLGLSAWILRD